VQAEAYALLAARPALRRVDLADGADTNWELLAAVNRGLGDTGDQGLEIVDFSHAGTPLKDGCDASWGESPPVAQRRLPGSRACSKKLKMGRSGSSGRSHTKEAAPPAHAASGFARP